MDAELFEMLQTIISTVEGMEKRLDAKIDAKIDALETRMEARLQTEIRGVKILIENDVGKRIEALFDGYKLSHEKQWELERKVEKLESRIERLETMAG